MALKKADTAKMLVKLKIAPDETTALAMIDDAAEKEVAIPDTLHVMTAPEVETRDRNKYNEGKTAGTEMVIKDIKTKHKVEIDGVDPDKVIEAITKKAVTDAGIAPDAQVLEQKKLVDQWKTKATSAEQQIASLTQEKTQLTVDNRIKGLFPKDRADILNDDEFLMSVKGRFSIETREGKEVVIDKATNDVVRDKVKLEPVAPADAIKGYFTERKWIAESPGGGGGGRGGGNSNPGGAAGKFTKLSEVRASIEAQGFNAQGEKGQALIQAAIKENPGIDMTS